MLKASSEHRVVTPKENFILCGYVPGKISNGVHDDIIMSGLLLKIKSKLIFMINIDLCMISKAIYNEIMSQLHLIHKDCEVLVTATHNHTGPSVQGYEHFGILDDAKESKYRQFLGKTALSIYQSLESKLEDCTVKYGKTHICGLYSSRINSKKESDKSIKSVQFINNQNAIVAELINIAVHSTVLNNQFQKYSSDLVGNVAKQIFRSTKTYPLIQIGAAGDSSTRFYREGSDEQELNRVSKLISKEILSIKHTKTITINDMKSKQVSYKINTVFNKDILAKKIEELTNVISRTTDKQTLKLNQSKLFALQLNLKREKIDVEVISYIYQIGEVTLITFPLEVDASLVSDFYIEDNIFIVNYANDYHGYIINKKDFDNTYEGMSSIFKKNEAEKFIEQIKKTL